MEVPLFRSESLNTHFQIPKLERESSDLLFDIVQERFPHFNPGDFQLKSTIRLLVSENKQVEKVKAIIYSALSLENLQAKLEQASENTHDHLVLGTMEDLLASGLHRQKLGPDSKTLREGKVIDWQFRPPDKFSGKAEKTELASDIYNRKENISYLFKEMSRISFRSKRIPDFENLQSLSEKEKNFAIEFLSTEKHIPYSRYTAMELAALKSRGWLLKNFNVNGKQEAYFVPPSKKKLITQQKESLRLFFAHHEKDFPHPPKLATLNLKEIKTLYKKHKIDQFEAKHFVSVFKLQIAFKNKKKNRIIHFLSHLDNKATLVPENLESFMNWMGWERKGEMMYPPQEEQSTYFMTKALEAKLGENFEPNLGPEALKGLWQEHKMDAFIVEQFLA